MQILCYWISSIAETVVMKVTIRNAFNDGINLINYLNDASDNDGNDVKIKCNQVNQFNGGEFFL